MAFDGDTYWFGTDDQTFSYCQSKVGWKKLEGGLEEYSDGWTEHHEGPDLVGQLSITNKRLWAAPMAGLFSCDRTSQEWTEHQCKFQSAAALSGLNVKALCTSPGYLWVGTADGGLSRYTLDQDEIPISRMEQTGKTYPLLIAGYESPRAVINTLVHAIHTGDVDWIYRCFTEHAQESLKEQTEKRGMTAVDFFRSWFEKAYSDSWKQVPDELVKDMQRKFMFTIVEGRWLMENRR